MATTTTTIKRTKFKLTTEQLLDMFYWLKLMRAFDLRLSILVKQGKVRSGVYTGIGQEAIIVGTCFALRKEDFICPLHRDLGSFLMKGVEPRAMMSQMFGKATGLSKGRDSALHSGVSELGIFGNTSMLGANLPVAAGLGLTFKMEKTDNVVVAYFGEGASNTGDFHEALNFAGVQRLPIVFVCENNLYAYSVPVEKSMAIDDVADRAESYGFDGVSINGNDVLAVYQSTQGALARARNGEGPTLIECKTYRWHGHSEHDKAFYRTDEELAMWKSRDPIPTFTTYLQAGNISERGEAEGNRRPRGGDDRRCRGICDERAGPRVPRTRSRISMPKELTYLEAIREALAEEMRRDPKVFVLGEDVGEYGGAFGVTQGLFQEFGESRVIDTPISESAIVGISIGASLRGYRPVAEMQFADFISCGFDQIVNQAATLRYRYGGRASVPIVVRAPSGGNVGGGLYHSQNPEAWFIHRPGLKVVAPSTPFDAKGLLKAAIRDDNPVVYFEHKYLYRRAKGAVPEGDEIVPIGVAATRREGDDITLLTYGAMVQPSLEAADRLSKDGVEVEVIDLRTLLPFDKDAILRSVEKTNRAMIVHEDVKTLGIGAELSAVIMEERFDALDAPVMRVTYPDTHCPFSNVLEAFNLPDADKITAALRKLAEY